MKTFEEYANEYGTATFEGKTYAITDEAFYKYRSHINGMHCLNPNSWVCAPAIDKDGNEYTLWYIETAAMADGLTDLDDIDYSFPDDVVKL